MKKIKPGLYLLTEKLANDPLRVDRRRKLDWSRKEFIAPGEFLVEDLSPRYFNINEIPVFAIRPIKEKTSVITIADRIYSTGDPEPFNRLIEALSPAPMTPSRVLFLKDELLVRDAKNVLDVLEKLFDAGRFTIEDVEKAADRVLEDWEAEED